MDWWNRLPCLAPIKGLTRFFSVWANYQDILADLKRREQRFQLLQESDDLMMWLEQAAQEPKRDLDQRLQAERQTWRTLGRLIDADVFAKAVASIERLQCQGQETSEDLARTVYTLAILLDAEADQSIIDWAFETLGPRVAEKLKFALKQVQTAQLMRGFS
jgi:hypothetical protein